MRRLAWTLAVAIVATMTITPSADATTRKHAIVIGDSITWMGEPYLLAMRPRWIVDGRRGRLVSQLPTRIRANLTEYGAPKHAVLALGQNMDPDWTRADYVRAVEMFPTTTQVHFVTTYRDPAIFGQEAADTQALYSRWMTTIAENRANVHLMDWRARVLDGRAVLEDGSHPDEPSRQVWADMVAGDIATVNAELAAP